MLAPGRRLGKGENGLDSAAITALVLFMVVLVTALVGLWVGALVDVVRAREMDDTSRLILALILILIAPVGLVVWALVRRSFWRTSLVLTLGLGLGLTAAVIVALAAVRSPQHVTFSGQARASVSVPAYVPPSVP